MDSAPGSMKGSPLPMSGSMKTGGYQPSNVSDPEQQPEKKRGGNIDLRRVPGVDILGKY